MWEVAGTVLYSCCKGVLPPELCHIFACLTTSHPQAVVVVDILDFDGVGGTRTEDGSFGIEQVVSSDHKVLAGDTGTGQKNSTQG